MLMESRRSVAGRSVVIEAEDVVNCRGLGPRARFPEVRAAYEPGRSDLQKPSILVRADHESGPAHVVGSGLRKLGYVVEVAPDQKAGLEGILADLDLVLYDASTFRMNGLADCLNILEQMPVSGDRRPSIKFVVVIGERERESDGGASDAQVRELGAEALSASAATKSRSNGQGPQTSPIGLTDREKEVLTWAARGKTSADIATILGLKQRTVNFHCDNAMKRLDVINRTQAVAKAVAGGLIGI